VDVLGHACRYQNTQIFAISFIPNYPPCFKYEVLKQLYSKTNCANTKSSSMIHV
jgi:hypothetical protein